MDEDARKAHRDVVEYERLCELYGEKPRWNGMALDCYGAHCMELKRRNPRDADTWAVMNS